MSGIVLGTIGNRTVLPGYAVPHVSGVDWGEGLTVTEDASGRVVWGGTKNFNVFDGTHAGTQLNVDGAVFPPGHFRPYVMRFEAGIDRSFGVGGIAVAEDFTLSGGDSVLADWEGTEVKVLSSGKILLATYYYGTGIPVNYGVLCFNDDGTLDHTFGTYGLTLSDTVGGIQSAQVGSLGVRSDGEIFIFGYRLSAGISRILGMALMPNGARDYSWGNFSPTNSYYEDFAPSGSFFVIGMSMQGDDIIVSGNNNDGSGNFSWIILRIPGATGVGPDATFGTAGYINVAFTDPTNFVCFPGGAIFDGSGKIVIAGSASFDFANHYCVALTRFSANGVLDTTFGTSGIAQNFTNLGSPAIYTLNDMGNARSYFFDGTKIVGMFNAYSTASSYHTPTQTMMLARYNSDGSLDTSLNGTGYFKIEPFDDDTGGNQVAYAGCLSPSTGKYLLSGHIWAGVNHGAGHSPGSRQFVARLNTDGSFDTTFGTGDPLQLYPGASAPSVVTGAVSSIGQTTATANATINPADYETVWLFQYGLASGRYHYKTAGEVISAGSIGVAVSVGLTGLASGLTYYGRAGAYSKIGITFGEEISFTTADGAESIYFQDTFTDSDGTQLVGFHNPDINLVGNQWDSRIITSGDRSYSDIIINSNKITTTNLAMAIIDVRRDNSMKITATFTPTAGAGVELDIFLRTLPGNPNNDHWAVSVFGGNFVIDERISAITTNRATSPQVLVNGTPYTIVVTVSGTTISATINGGNDISSNSFSTLSGNNFVGFLGIDATTDDVIIQGP